MRWNVCFKRRRLVAARVRRSRTSCLRGWNADDCGGFNLIDLWAVDSDISSDMVLVFSLVRQFHKYPDTLGYKKEFEALVRQWRPNLT